MSPGLEHTLPTDRMHSGIRPNPYRPVPGFRLKGIVGYDTSKRQKPEMVRLQGQIFHRSVRARIYKDALRAFRQHRRRLRAITAKQARKLNRERGHGQVDWSRIRGRRTVWGG